VPSPTLFRSVPVLARLVLARAQRIDRQVAQGVARGGFEFRRVGGGLGPEQGLQAAAEAALFCGCLRGRLRGRWLGGAHAGVWLMSLVSCRACCAACSRSRWRRTISPARPR